MAELVWLPYVISHVPFGWQCPPRSDERAAFISDNYHDHRITRLHGQPTTYIVEMSLTVARYTEYMLKFGPND
jgi:hypothetical protein